MIPLDQPANRSLKDRVAIVTGAGAQGDGIGNGRAAAILLARDGARVGLIDRNIEDAEATRRLIEADGGQAMVLRCDVGKPDDCAAAIQAAFDAWRRIDILINNVGIGGPPGNAVELDLEAWDQAMRINVTSMMLMARFAIPKMRLSGGGSIVNIASVAGLLGGHPGLLYPTSKGAVINLTRAMAAQHGAEGIRVNCVAPGMVYTPMVYGKGMSEEKRKLRQSRALLPTEGSGWDVGHAVRFLAGDEARWVTGVIFPVDGGSTAARPLPGSSPDHAYLNRTG